MAKTQSEINKAYYERHREKMTERAKAYREKHREQVLAYLKEWRQKNREKVLAYLKHKYHENRDERLQEQRTRRAKDPEALKAYQREQYRKNAAKRRQDSIAYAKRHPDRIRARKIQYDRTHRDVLRAARKRFIAKHPTYNSANKSKRRSKLVAAEGRHTTADIAAIWERQCKKCAIYGCSHPITETKGKYKYHVDHIISLKDKGSNWPSNLQILCAHHNNSKGALSPEKWAERLSRSGLS